LREKCADTRRSNLIRLIAQKGNDKAKFQGKIL
jgi:hypothetical protein